MQFRRLFADDDAVSPVIGVILMVAITVILAAVIASFVLGLGDNTDSVAPNTNFEFDYSSSDGTLEISVSGGDSVSPDQLTITGELTDGQTVEDNTGTNINNNTWTAFAGSSDDLGAGDSILLEDGTTLDGQSVEDDYSLRVVWSAQSGDQTSTLARSSGPDA